MRRKAPRENLPLPVAPIPKPPIFSKDLELPEALDRLYLWYNELDNWLHIWRKRNATFYRRLPKIEEQVRLLIQHADEYLPEIVPKKHGFVKPTIMALFYELLARCLGNSDDADKDGETIQTFKRAMALAPGAATYWYSYVRYLILTRSLSQALDEINAVDVRLIQTEHESIAQQIINWALSYPEIGCGIRQDLIKHCIALVSRVGTGLLVRGCPLPHPPDMKWQRTEILRVLWAGMQCSMPIDELCKREGIDQATYYGWRKRFLPKEWGTAPALV